MSHPEKIPQTRLLYDVHEMPPLPKLILFAFQHVVAMFSATVLMSICVNNAVNEVVIPISTTLVASGLGTLAYQILTKHKSPVYLGSSFAFIAPITTAYVKGGLGGAMTGVMLVGIVYCIFAAMVRLAGTNWIRRLLPPIVVGPTIMVIGLSLAPTAVSQIGLAKDSVFEWKVVTVAAVSCLSTILFSIKARGLLKVIPILAGILLGYATSAIFGMVDLQPVLEAAWFQTPKIRLPFVHYSLDFGTALTTMVSVSLVTMAEHIGDHTATSRIINRDLLVDPGLDRTLAGDGFGSFIAGLIGGPPNTTYGENSAVVGITRVASVRVISLAACFAVCLGFLGKFTALVSTIPSPVFGGISLILYGYIAVNGLKELIENQINMNDMRNCSIGAVMLILAAGDAAIAPKFGNIVITLSGMSLVTIIGILLNLFLPYDKSQTDLQPAANEVMK